MAAERREGLELPTPHWEEPGTEKTAYSPSLTGHFFLWQRAPALETLRAGSPRQGDASSAPAPGLACRAVPKGSGRVSHLEPSFLRNQGARQAASHHPVLSSGAKVPASFSSWTWTPIIRKGSHSPLAPRYGREGRGHRSDSPGPTASAWPAAAPPRSGAACRFKCDKAGGRSTASLAPGSDICTRKPAGTGVSSGLPVRGHGSLQTPRARSGSQECQGPVCPEPCGLSPHRAPRPLCLSRRGRQRPGGGDGAASCFLASLFPSQMKDRVRIRGSQPCGGGGGADATRLVFSSWAQDTVR